MSTEGWTGMDSKQSWTQDSFSPAMQEFNIICHQLPAQEVVRENSPRWQREYSLYKGLGWPPRSHLMHLVTHFGASFCSSAHSGEVGKKVHNVRDCKPRWDPGGRAADHNPQTQPRPHVWGLGRGESLRLSGHPSDRPRHRTGPGAGNCVRAQDCSCGSVSKSFLIYSSPSLCLPKTPPSISPFPHLINTK